MLVNSMGSAQRFTEIPKGGAFSFKLRDGQYIGIKVDETPEVGAVVIALGRCEVGADVPRFLEASSFGLVRSLPELQFVLSPHADDMSTGLGANFDPGKVYLFGPGQEFLSFNYRSAQSRIGRDFLLNINTGDVTHYNEFRNACFPVEVSRWALVLEAWDRPITLFTYPASGEPLTF